jgi:hypothetical protein
VVDQETLDRRHQVAGTRCHCLPRLLRPVSRSVCRFRFGPCGERCVYQESGSLSERVARIQFMHNKLGAFIRRFGIYAGWLCSLRTRDRGAKRTRNDRVAESNTLIAGDSHRGLLAR